MDMYSLLLNLEVYRSYAEKQYDLNGYKKSRRPFKCTKPNKNFKLNHIIGGCKRHQFKFKFHPSVKRAMLTKRITKGNIA